MLKKRRDEVVFDALISKALSEASMKEINKLEKIDITEVELTAKHKREERRYYNRLERAKNPTTRHTIAYKIAACFLICMVVSLLTIFAIPTARADFMKLITKPFDKYTSFGTVTDSIFADAEYSFDYIPRGFELVEYKKDLTKIFRYENIDGDYFKIIYRQGKDVGSLHDNENVVIRQITIKNQIGYVVKEGDNQKVIWSNGDYIIIVQGNISENILINIANNIN